MQQKSPSNDQYMLSRDGRESIRLTAQHYCLVERQGWLIHPTIKDAIREISNPQIVDVATGTGIWLMEVSRQLPQATLLGLDISDAQYPPKWTWAENVSFELYDLLQEVPDTLRGKFDVVHVRLLVAAGPKVDKSIFIDSFQTLLKPGGWLQWDELAWPLLKLVHPPSPSHGASADIESRQHPTMHFVDTYGGLLEKTEWVNEFEEILGVTGVFDSTSHLVVPVRPEVLAIETELTIAVASDMMEAIMKRRDTNDAKAQQEMREAVARMYQDSKAGLFSAYNWHVAIARKI